MTPFRAQCFFAVALVLFSSSSAFVPNDVTRRSCSTTHLNVAIDPRDLLSEDDSAMTLVSQDDTDDRQLLGLQMNADNKVVATAVAGSAIGVVAGSPLLLGAALGLAGSKFLDDSEEGLKNRKMLEQFGQQITEKVQNAVHYTQTELLEDNENTDLSTVSKKIFTLLQSKAETLQDDAKKMPSSVSLALKEKLESEEFQQDLKQAPARAFAAFKGLVESEEVKTASGSMWNALKASLDSDEMKALKSRASQAVKESLESKKAE